MCRTILMPLTYSNAEEIFYIDLTCYTKKRTWTLQEKNTLRRC